MDNMNYKEASEVIGKEGTIIAAGFRIGVKVLDYKNSYGKDRWLVTPVTGSGQVWVEQSPMQ